MCQIPSKNRTQHSPFSLRSLYKKASQDTLDLTSLDCTKVSKRREAKENVGTEDKAKVIEDDAQFYIVKPGGDEPYALLREQKNSNVYEGVKSWVSPESMAFFSAFLEVTKIKLYLSTLSIHMNHYVYANADG